MNAAVLGGLVEQWVWRCQKLATRYQLRQPMDLKREIEHLVGQAVAEAHAMGVNGAVFLARVEGRLDITAQIAVMPEPLKPDKLTDPVSNSAGRAEALQTLADAFGAAAQRLKPAA
jgi:hypothetical protein